MSQHTSPADWYEHDRLAPFVRSRKAAGEVLTMLEAGQPAGDMSDPPTSDLILLRTMSGDIRHHSDFGAGAFSERSRVGTLLLIPPGTATNIEVQNDHVIRCFGFDSSHFGPMLSEARGAATFDFGALHTGGFQSPLILQLIDRLWAEAEFATGTTRLFTEGASLAILGELSRLAQQPLFPVQAAPRDWRLRRAIEYLEARIGDDVGLSEIAAEVDLSPSYLRDLFRTGTGEPPHRWLMRRRFERACEMLADPRVSITEVAHNCGFASSQHLATVFQKQLGTTPSAYRRERLS